MGDTVAVSELDAVGVPVGVQLQLPVVLGLGLGLPVGLPTESVIQVAGRQPVEYIDIHVGSCGSPKKIA